VGTKAKIDVYSRPAIAQNLPLQAFGAVAQLIERVVRNDEVVGLIPICSTSLRGSETKVQAVLPNCCLPVIFECDLPGGVNFRLRPDLVLYLL